MNTSPDSRGKNAAHIAADSRPRPNSVQDLDTKFEDLSSPLLRTRIPRRHQTMSAAGAAVPVEQGCARSSSLALRAPAERDEDLKRVPDVAFTLDSDGRVSPWDEGAACLSHAPAPITCSIPLRAYVYGLTFSLPVWALALWVVIW
jgi:hypothetical protein